MPREPPIKFEAQIMCDERRALKASLKYFIGDPPCVDCVQEIRRRRGLARMSRKVERQIARAKRSAKRKRTLSG